MEYTWKVENMTVKDTTDLQNAVYRVFWWKTGTDENGDKGSFYGVTEFKLSDLDPENFIPFEELTEEVVLGWVQATITEDIERHYNFLIQKDLEGKKYPEKNVTPPWIASPEPQPAAPVNQ